MANKQPQKQTSERPHFLIDCREETCNPQGDSSTADLKVPLWEILDSRRKLAAPRHPRHRHLLQQRLSQHGAHEPPRRLHHLRAALAVPCTVSLLFKSVAEERKS
jgi:hypothetical protein